MTPEEFIHTWDAWKEQKEADIKEQWEMMRLQTTILIQPHVKEKIDPKKLLPYPWDEKKKSPEPMSKEKRRRIAEEALRKWG